MTNSCDEVSRLAIDKFKNRLPHMASLALSGVRVSIAVRDMTEAVGFMGLQDGDIIPTTVLFLAAPTRSHCYALQLGHQVFSKAAKGLGIDVIGFCVGDDLPDFYWGVDE